MNPAPAARQRGAALLMALIIVTVVSSLAVSMVWQQWRAVQVETAERSRQQSAWILSGAMSWTRVILREDTRSDNSKRKGNEDNSSDDLGEAWAAPLAEARISTFLAVDKENTDDGPEAFLSGRIVDAQSRFNLAGMVVPGNPGVTGGTGTTGGTATGTGTSTGGEGSSLPGGRTSSGAAGAGQGTAVRGPQVRLAQVEAFKRLCNILNLNPAVATVIVQGFIEATPPFTSNSTARPLLPERVDQLAWFGVDPGTIKALAPYVVFIRDPENATLESAVNLNTASREVIAAVLDVDMATAANLVQRRQNPPLSAANTHTKYVPARAQGAPPLPPSSYKSNYFLIDGRLRLESQVLEQRSLVRRQGMNVKAISSEWVNSSDPG